MGWLMVNGKSVTLNGETSVLEVVRNAGVDILRCVITRSSVYMVLAVCVW